MLAKILKGYRVLDLTDESGVYGTKLLADLGAEVIKAEPPTGDRVRRLPPFIRDEGGSERSLFFAYMNTNKRSITLDLECAEGQALFRDLAKKADLVYETYPPGYLSALGIGYPELSQTNPMLIWVSLAPFGQSGPRRDWLSSDLIAWATSGLLYCTGDADRPPVNPVGPALSSYYLASLNGTVGAILALMSRRIRGRGQLVDISIQEAACIPEVAVTAFLDDLVPRKRVGSRPSSAPGGLFPCKDGYITIATGMAHHWDALAAWIREITGIEGVQEPILRELRYRLEIREVIDEWVIALTRQYSKQEMFEEGQRRGIPITPVNTVADIVHDPHLEARRYWEEVNDPNLGMLRMPGAPYRFSNPAGPAVGAPLLGQDNESIYCGELGLTASELAALRANGVI